jgi:hypothetical protein
MVPAMPPFAGNQRAEVSFRVPHPEPGPPWRDAIRDALMGVDFDA